MFCVVWFFLLWFWVWGCCGLVGWWLVGLVVLSFGLLWLVVGFGLLCVLPLGLFGFGGCLVFGVWLVCLVEVGWFLFVVGGGFWGNFFEVWILFGGLSRFAGCVALFLCFGVSCACGCAGFFPFFDPFFLFFFFFSGAWGVCLFDFSGCWVGGIGAVEWTRIYSERLRLKQYRFL